MRIFFTNASLLYPPKDGPAIHRYQLIKRFVEAGHHVITLEPDENPLADVRSKKPLAVLRALRSADVVYCRPGERPDASSRLTAPERRWLIPRRCPVIWEQNRALTVSLSSTKPRSPEEIQRNVEAFRVLAQRVDAAIGVCDMASEQLRDLLGIERVVTIHNGSDPSMFRPDVSAALGLARGQERLHAAFIGSRTNAIHDAALITRAGRLIDERQLPVDVHVIGRTEEMFPEPRPACLHLHGPISYMDLPSYLAGMDVGLALYVSRVDGGSPLKIFDYLASGAVPICSPGRSLDEILQGTDAGFIERFTPESLVERLATLQRDRSTLDAMRERGRELIVTRHNWESIAQRVLTVIEDAVERRRRR